MVMDETPKPDTCPRDGVETRLRCSSCETLICPECWQDAAVGFHCPDCAERRTQTAQQTGDRIRGSRGQDTSSAGDAATIAQNVRVGGVGLGAAVLGGLLLGPVLVAGTFFLISAGVVGWLVARAVYWAAEEASTPLVRSMALTLAGFSVAVGFVSAGAPPVPASVALLAYPAAVWGGWILVRRR